MSLRHLPTEIKQLVVDQAHRSDQAYQHRSQGVSASSEQSKWRGKAVHSLSFVNKEWRALSLKYIVTTLRASRARDPIFDSSFFGTATGALITRLHVEPSTSFERISFLVIYIIPQLPNLYRITLSSGALGTISPKSPSSTSRGFLLPLLARIAQTRITEWDVELTKSHNYAPLVFANPSTLRSLTVRPYGRQQIALLEAATSTFAVHLAQCTALETLKLSFAKLDRGIDSLVDDKLLASQFSCSSTLRSLEIELVSRDRGPGTTQDFDFSLLRFSAFFTSLDSLTLSLTRFDPMGFADLDEANLMPRLIRLHLIDVDSLRAVRAICHRLSCPNLANLVVRFGRDAQFDSSDSQFLYDLDWVQDAVDTVSCGISASLSCRFEHTVGMTRARWDHVEATLAPAVVTKDWDDGAREATSNRVSREDDNSDSREDDNSDSSEDDSSEDDDVVAVLQDRVDELATWAREKAARCGVAGDERGACELWQEMRGLSEYKKWMAD
ncbi:hypothetical protein JCM11491_005032 [Sporobolomyces phaffii]